MWERLRKHRRTVLVVFGLWAGFGLLNVSRMRILHSLYIPEYSWAQAFQWGFPDALYWAVLSLVPILLARRYPFRWQASRIGLHLGAALLVAAAHSLVDASCIVLLTDRDLWTMFQFRLRESLHLNVLIYGLVVAMTQFYVYSARVREERRRSSELKAQLAEAKLAALRMQIQPHFTLNTLNTVNGLIDQDPEAARRVLARLGDLMRSTLREGDAGDEIPLAEELDYARSYLGIVEERFRDRLQVRFDIEDDCLRMAVPVLVLQPLIENAVRHGVGNTPEGGWIEVGAQRENGNLRLRVSDSGGTIPEATLRRLRGGAGANGAGGIGLRNVQERLRGLYGPNGSMTLENLDPGVRVTLEMPARNTMEPGRS